MKASLSAYVRKPWKRLIDVHKNSGFNRVKKNPSRVTAVTKETIDSDKAALNQT